MLVITTGKGVPATEAVVLCVVPRLPNLEPHDVEIQRLGVK